MEGRRRLHGAFSIDIALIEPDPNQPRKKIDPVHLSELTQSIRRHGILQPISVRFIEESGRYRIVAGECRFTAAKQAGLADMPCWLKTPKDHEILVEQIVENWVRSGLNPFELADSLAILRDANGYTQKMLAEETGKSPGEISKLLSILSLDAEVQSVARSDESGRVAKRHLYALSRLPAPMQTSLLQKVQLVRDGLGALVRSEMAEQMELSAEQRRDPLSHTKCRVGSLRQVGSFSSGQSTLSGRPPPTMIQRTTAVADQHEQPPSPTRSTAVAYQLIHTTLKFLQ